MKPEDIMIIGAGPAGIAAAIQLKRSDVPFTLLEKERVGGLLWNANLVENYPGFPAGIAGPKLVHLFEKQMKSVGVRVTFDEVTCLGVDGGLVVETPGKQYRPQVVLVATGTKPKKIPLQVPVEVCDRVHSAVFPLLALHGSRIAIIGAGDAAFDYALNLARNNAVTILHRSQTTDCLPLLRSRARACERIIVRSDVEVTRIEADSSGSGLRLGCLSKDGEDIIVCDHLIFAIGRQPQLDFIQPSQREQLEALAESRRLFFVGDVTNGQLRQTAIAVGDGLRAAMRIFAYIRSSGDA